MPASGSSLGFGNGSERFATINLNSDNFDKFIYQNLEVIVVAFIVCGAQALQTALP